MDLETEPDGESLTAADQAKLAAAAERMHMSIGEFAGWIFDATVDTATPPPPMTRAEQALLADSSGLTADELFVAERDPDRWQANAVAQHAHLLRSSLATTDAGDRLGIKESAVRQRLRKRQLWSYLLDGAHRIPDWQFLKATDPERDDNRTVATSLYVYGPDGDRAARPLPIDGIDFFVKPGHDVSQLKDELGATWDELLTDNVHWSDRHRDSGRALYFDSHLVRTIRLRAIDALGNPLSEPVEVPVPTTHWRTLPGLEEVVPSIPKDAAPASLESFMTARQDDLLVNDVPWPPVRWLQEGRDPNAVADLLKSFGSVW